MQSGRLDAASQVHIRDNLMQYARSQYRDPDGSTPQDPLALQNKVCQALTYLFANLYGTDWTTFFDDMLALAGVDNGTLGERPTAVVFYLKVLASVHDEIADVLAPRNAAEQSRNTELKDMIRSRDVQKLASSWRLILARFKLKDTVVLERCLSVIGRWATWIDLGLIIDNDVLDLFFEFVSSGLSSKDDSALSLRDTTLNAILEILGKKMDIFNKLGLIEALKINDVVSQLSSSAALQELRYTSNYDTDLAEIVAKLVNQTMSDLIIILDESKDQALALRAHSHLMNILPFMLRYFSDEYDEVSSSVIPCMTDMLVSFRKNKQSNVNVEYISTLPSILQAIMAKMRYDETCEWGADDSQTDEAEFQDLRKRLASLQQSIAAIDQDLLINSEYELVTASLKAFQERSDQVDWRDLELALHEMYTLGQYTGRSGALYHKGEPASQAAERLISVMRMLVEVDIATSSHPAVHLQYLELCVRYCSFFEANPAVIPQTLENFIKFVHHKHAKVKLRSWYLFYRFVRQLRPQVGSMAETIVRSIADLLHIKAEIPETSSDDGSFSSNDNETPHDSTFINQLYLYEAVGDICSSPALSPSDQVRFVRLIAEPILVDLRNAVNYAMGQDEKALLQVHHLIMALGSLAQGFSEWLPSSNKATASSAPARELSEEFSKSAEAILAALKTLSSPPEVRVAARSALSRLVGALGSNVLPQLPQWIDSLLPRDQSKEDTITVLRLLNQLVYGFKTEMQDILNTLLTPLLQRVFQGLAETTTGTDDELQLAEVKSHYVSFLLVILNNDLGQVFVSNENQPIFETIIETLQHFARDINDLPSAKLAFSVMTRMVTTWGGPDVAVRETGPPLDGLNEAERFLKARSGDPQPLLPGFDRFAIERFSPLVWGLPLNEKFNGRDARSRQVLVEAAGLVKAIYAKTGQHYLSYLKTTELPGLGWNESSVQTYLKALVTPDPKKFQQHFQVGWKILHPDTMLTVDLEHHSERPVTVYGRRHRAWALHGVKRYHFARLTGRGQDDVGRRTSICQKALRVVGAQTKASHA